MSIILKRGMLVTVMLGLWATGAWAQGRGAVVEAGGGWAGFVDEALINHSVVQAAARMRVTPRIAIGPEVSYMRGPGEDRDWFLTGNITADLRESSSDVVPYIVAGAGLARMTNSVGTGLFTSSEGTFTAGVGARVALTDRWYIAPEFRFGWEPHTRLGVVAGLRF